MAKYKVGDKIKLKDDFCFGDFRDSYKGDIATITGVHPNATIYRINVDKGMYAWGPDSIEGLVEGYHPHKLDVKIALLDNELTPPSYAHYNDSGFDCVSASKESITINPGEIALVPLGFKIAVPTGFELQLRPKSGLALKKKLTLQNSPGTVDAGYRNEVGAIVRNEGTEPYVVEYNKPIVQGIIAPIYKAEFEYCSSSSLDSPGRNSPSHERR
jgi:dUTP pyrophosphatase